MEGLTMNFKGKMGTFIVSKLLEKYVRNKLGYKVNISLEDLSIHRNNGAILTVNNLVITCDDDVAEKITNDIVKG